MDIDEIKRYAKRNLELLAGIPGFDRNEQAEEDEFRMRQLLLVASIAESLAKLTSVGNWDELVRHYSMDERVRALEDNAHTSPEHEATYEKRIEALELNYVPPSAWEELVDGKLDALHKRIGALEPDPFLPSLGDVARDLTKLEEDVTTLEAKVDAYQGRNIQNDESLSRRISGLEGYHN